MATSYLLVINRSQVTFSLCKCFIYFLNYRVVLKTARPQYAVLL